MGGGPDGAVLLELLFARLREADVVVELLRTKTFVAEHFFALEDEETPKCALGDLVGGDDCADCLRYLVATKSHTIAQRKLRGL